MWGSIAGDIGGSLIGGAFNAHEASKNRKFQDKMSRTQYQRAAQDLEAAGLNRVLALGSPAPTPSGATASMEAPKPGSTGIAASTAKQAIAQGRAQENLIKAQEAMTHDQATNLNAQTAKALAETRLTTAEAEKAEITKGLYRALGPSAEKIFELIGGGTADFLDRGTGSAAVSRVADTARSAASAVGRTVRDNATWLPRGIAAKAKQWWEKLKSMDPRNRQ